MERGEGNNISIPRGGPVFVPELTSALTSTPEFERKMFDAIKELDYALGAESLSDADEEEFSLEELRVFTDKELISMGMKEAFKEDRPEKTAEEIYLEKVAELVKIRNRQKHDRASARLHSLKNNRSKDENRAASKDKNRAASKDENRAPSKDKNRAAVSSENTDRLRSLESVRSPTKINSTITREHVSIHYPETVLFIEIYSGQNSSMKTQEILVLGQQKLTELKDAINCVTDAIMRKDDYHDPSGYFLIQDVFYNDMRDPSAIDYSEPIFDWLINSREEALEKWDYIQYGGNPIQKALLGKKTKPPMPHFKAVKMEETLFSNLQFRVGARYLYCHQGDCKHDIVIRDMRLVHLEDCQNRAAYPLVGFQRKVRVHKCFVCGISKATCFTVDDEFAGENPCYFCDNCYQLLHYDEKGALQYDHVVHKYIQGH